MNLSHGHVAYADVLNFSDFLLVAKKLKLYLWRRSHALHRIIGNLYYLCKCYVRIGFILHEGMENLIY